jgi:hypothetical protein
MRSLTKKLTNGRRLADRNSCAAKTLVFMRFGLRFRPVVGKIFSRQDFQNAATLELASAQRREKGPNFAECVAVAAEPRLSPECASIGEKIGDFAMAPPWYQQFTVQRRADMALRSRSAYPRYRLVQLCRENTCVSLWPSIPPCSRKNFQ